MSRLNKLVQESVRLTPVRRLPIDDSLVNLLWQLKCGVDQAELARSRTRDESAKADHRSPEEPSSN